MSRNALARFAAPLVGAAVVALLAVAPAAAEPIPGPPARPGQTPIGGAALAGTKVVYTPKPGEKVKPPDMSAASWILADADTGEVLAAKAPHARYRPASTLKTLTAVTLMPRLDPKSTYTATKADIKVDGSMVGLAPGEKYTIEQLWTALLLPSANDAASALANANGGVETTVGQMNAKALRLQALDTVAKSPSGLDYTGQWTSAYDMALIGRAALALPDFRRISTTTRAKFPDTERIDGQRTSHTIYGENRLLNHGYEGIVGGKTGYTTEASRTYWVAAQRDGRTLILSMFRIAGMTEPAARTLLNWGFANADKLEPIGTLVPPLTNEQLAAEAASGSEAAATELAAAPTDAAALAPGSEPAEEQAGGFPWGWLLIIGIAVLGILAFLRYRAVQSSSGAHRTGPRPAHEADDDRLESEPAQSRR